MITGVKLAPISAKPSPFPYINHRFGKATVSQRGRVNRSGLAKYAGHGVKELTVWRLAAGSAERFRLFGRGLFFFHRRHAAALGGSRSQEFFEPLTAKHACSGDTAAQPRG
jgi:hypothetical protein